MHRGRVADQLARLGDVLRPLHEGQRDPVDAELEGEGQIGAVLLGHRRDRQHDSGTLTPLRSVSRPPVTTSVSANSAPQVSDRAGAAGRRRAAGRCPAPAPRTSRDGAAARGGDRPAPASRSRRNRWPASSSTPPPGTLPIAQLWALQIDQDADRPAGLRLDLADGVEPRAVIVMGAMAEIEPEDIGAGIEQRADGAPALRSPARAWRRSWRCVGVCRLSRRRGAGHGRSGWRGSR